MGLYESINTAILFIAAYCLWFILRWAVLPHLKIFPYIPPQFIWVNLYNALAYIGTTLFHWVLAGLFFIWVLWRIIKQFVPFFIFIVPVRPILLALPPFPQLEAVGIFALFDELVMLLFRMLPFQETLKEMGRTFQRFIRKSMWLVIDSARGKASGPPPGHPPVAGGGTSASWGGGGGSSGPDQPLQNRENDDFYTQCVAENTEPIYPELGSVEKTMIMAKNSGARAMCSVKKLQQMADTLTYMDFA